MASPDLELACMQVTYKSTIQSPRVLPTRSILLILTPLSYLPINRNIAAMLTIPPTKGISITAALLLALCAQSQVVNMYYLWVCNPATKWGMVVPKPPRRIDFINLAQIVTQWICAVGLCVHSITSHLTSRSSNSSALPFPPRRILTVHIHVAYFSPWICARATIPRSQLIPTIPHG